MSGHPDGVTALVFDAYGTLFDVYSVMALSERLFPGNGALLAQVWRDKQLQYSLLRTAMGRHRDFWRVTEDALVWTAAKLGLALTPDHKAQLLDAYRTLAAFPDARPALAALKQRGVRLAILSNGEPAMLAAAVASAGLGDLLDDIISVEDVQVFKPNPRVYNWAAERMQVRNGELALVSSNNWDIVGAASAGLRTIWVARDGALPPEELSFRAEFVVTALTALPDLLGR